MTIQGYDVYATYGALDSTAFDDATFGGGPEILGQCFSAHLLRAMALDHNRLMKKTEHLFTLVWPVVSSATGGDGQAAEAFGGICEGAWGLFHPPIPIFKKKGHIAMTVSMIVRVAVSTGSAHAGKLTFQCVTGAAPFNPSAVDVSPNVLEVSQAQADGFVTISQADIPLVPGSMDFLALYARGDVTDNAPNVGTYGSPAGGTLNAANDALNNRELIDASATWNSSNDTNRCLANEGFAIIFHDGSNNPIAAPRKIVRVGGTTTGILYFRPDLTDDEILYIRGYGGGHYLIRALPLFWISSITAYSKERSV